MLTIVPSLLQPDDNKDLGLVKWWAWSFSLALRFDNICKRLCDICDNNNPKLFDVKCLCENCGNFVLCLWEQGVRAWKYTARQTWHLLSWKPGLAWQSWEFQRAVQCALIWKYDYFVPDAEWISYQHDCNRTGLSKTLPCNEAEWQTWVKVLGSDCETHAAAEE